MSQLEAEQQLVPEGADKRGSTSDRRRWWWLLVLLLLLLLLACVLVQALFPSPRTASSSETSQGLTAVFGVYGLHQPLAVASGPNGEIAVSDTGVQRADLFDKNGVFVTRLGGVLPQNKLFSVDGLVFVGDTIYITDFALRRVWEVSTDGSVKGFFPKDATDKGFGASGFVPYDVAPFGDDLLVSARGGIYRFDQRTKVLQGRFDKAAPRDIPLSFVNGLAVEPNGDRVYAADVLNRRVVAFDRSGKPVWSLGLPDSGNKIVGFFGLPRGLAVTDEGLLVSDTFNHVLYLLDRDGNLLGTYGERGVVDGKFNFPEGIDVAPDGLVYVADRENNRVQVLRLGTPVAPTSAMKKKWDASIARFND